MGSGENLLILENLSWIRDTLDAYHDVLCRIFSLIDSCIVPWVMSPTKLEKEMFLMPEETRKKLAKLFKKLEKHNKSLDDTITEIINVLEEDIEAYHRKVKDTLKDSEGSGHG